MSIWYNMREDKYGLRLYGKLDDYSNIELFLSEIVELVNKGSYPKNAFLNVCFYNSVSAIYIYPTVKEKINTEINYHFTLSLKNWEKVADDKAKKFAEAQITELKEFFESKFSSLNMDFNYSFYDWDDFEGLKIKLL